MFVNDALVTALLEVERHVGHGGWDQPARLFALVPTAELLAAEPSLAAQLAHTDPAPDALSSVEQDGFHAGNDLVGDLDRITWPAAVAGCAIAVERTFVPPDVEPELPEDPEDAAAFVASHPRRQDIRVVVGVLRGGDHHGLARLRTRSEDLLGGADLVPGLTAALALTLA